MSGTATTLPSGGMDTGKGVLLPGVFRVPGPDGAVEHTGEFTPEAHTRAFLRAIFPVQASDGQYFEVVHGPRLQLGGGRQRLAVKSRARRGNVALDFETGEPQYVDGEPKITNEVAPDCVIPLTDVRAAEAPINAARTRVEEIFCGVLPRVFDQRGLAIPDAFFVRQGSVIWVDIDDPTQVWRLEAFSPRPHLIARSGSGGAHGYWRVKAFEEDGARSIAAAHIERANERLIYRVAGDYASYDRLRMMRVPGTYNSKAKAWARVQYADLSMGAYDIRDVVGDLPDPPDEARPQRVGRKAAAARQRRPRRRDRDDARYRDDPARHLLPREYVARLAGVQVDRGGYCRCPLPDHDERTGSFKCYPKVDEGWYCYGCRRGGSVYEFAEALSGIPVNQRFKELKAWTWDRLGLGTP